MSIPRGFGVLVCLVWPMLASAITETKTTYTLRMGTTSDPASAVVVAQGLVEPGFKVAGTPSGPRYFWVQTEKTMVSRVSGSGFFNTVTSLEIPATVVRGEQVPVRISARIDNPAPHPRYGTVALRVIEEDRGWFSTLNNVVHASDIGNIQIGSGGLVPDTLPSFWEDQREALLDISSWEPDDAVAEVRAECVFTFGGQDLTWPFGTDYYSTDLMNVQIVTALPAMPKPGVRVVADGWEVYWPAMTARTQLSPVGSTAAVITVATETSPTIGGAVQGAGQYGSGSTVYLTAVAAPGYRFNKWEGPGIAGGLRTRNPLDLTLTTSGTYRAVFTETRRLILRCEPENGGKLTGDGTYDINTTVTIRNLTNPGYRFIRWEGGPVASNTAEGTTITMDLNYTVVAIYDPPLALVTRSFPEKAGTAVGGGLYAGGSWVDITAIPADGFKFIGWTGEGIEDPTLSVTRVLVDKQKMVTANFGGSRSVDIEYFIDIDPGEGYGIPLPMPDGGLVFPLDTMDLKGGMHTIGVRALADDMTWGMTRYASFEVIGTEETPPGPLALEYTIDGKIDYGPRTQISLPGETLTYPANINQLAPGSHKIEFRLNHGGGYVGLTTTRDIFLAEVEDAAVKEIEYFVGNDPGLGQGRKVSVTSGADFTTTFEPAESLFHMGMNQIGIRARSEDGGWGLVGYRHVAVVEQEESGIGGVNAYFTDGTSWVPGTWTGIFLPDGNTATGSFNMDTHALQAGRTYSLWVEALSAGGIPAIPVKRDLVVLAAASPGALYQTWVKDSGYFPGADADNQAICGFLADPDGDGIPNGNEYAFGTNPRDSSSRFQPSAATQDGHFMIRYRQKKGGEGTVGTGYTAAGVRYTVQYAESIAPDAWRTGSDVVEAFGAPVDNGDGTETVTVRAKASISMAPRGFLRVYLELL